jgi:hypothetical protein
MVDEPVGEAVPMGRSCPWCSAAAPADATTCPACGAALAQRESIGDLVLPGITDVRGDLLDAAGRPLHMPVQSNAQGMAGGVMLAAMAGGPVGLAALGGLAAVGAAEYVGASRRDDGSVPSLDDLGRPSSAAEQTAHDLDAKGERGPDAPAEPWKDANDPWRDLAR